jgi:glycosyltransferase involved in cell wall biosynthesis
MLIDVSRLVGRLLKGRLPTGIDRVGLAYVRRYGQQARAVIGVSGSAVICGNRGSEAVFDWLLRMGEGGKGWSTIWRSLFPDSARTATGQVFFNTGHTQLDNRRYIVSLRRLGVKPLLLIHDLIPISHPQFCRAGELLRHQARIQNAIGVAAGIICNSEATMGELQAYARRTGLAMPPAVAAALASDLPTGGCTQNIHDIGKPYFLVLSTIEPRKNHLMLLQVWQRLVERLGPAAPRLVLVGQRGWECEHVTRLLDRSELLRPFVTEKNHCSDAELVTLMRDAQALLLPSFVEGYGMPVVEALTHRLPVIASDLPVFREFAGLAPEYVDPLDAPRWTRLIESYTRRDSPERARQLTRMAGFKAPNWSDHFERVDELLERVEHREAASA